MAADLKRKKKNFELNFSTVYNLANRAKSGLI